LGDVTLWYQSLYGSNIRLVWANNQCKLGKFIVADFGLCIFGEKQRKQSEIPKFMRKFEFKLPQNPLKI
jgi:hypothetical protein